MRSFAVDGSLNSGPNVLSGLPSGRGGPSQQGKQPVGRRLGRNASRTNVDTRESISLERNRPPPPGSDYTNNISGHNGSLPSNSQS